MLVCAFQMKDKESAYVSINPGREIHYYQRGSAGGLWAISEPLKLGAMIKASVDVRSVTSETAR